MFKGIADRIGDDKGDGVTPLDIMELPRAQQQILLFMLRDQNAAVRGLTRDELTAKFSTHPALEATLAELSKQGWLVALGEPPTQHFKINLKRKRGSSLQMWASVMDRLDADTPAAPPKGLLEKLSTQPPPNPDTPASSAPGGIFKAL